MPMEKLQKLASSIVPEWILLAYLSYILMYFATKASRWKICLLPSLHLCS
jgi:hypothetical protein